MSFSSFCIFFEKFYELDTVFFIAHGEKEIKKPFLLIKYYFIVRGERFQKLNSKKILYDLYSLFPRRALRNNKKVY